MSCKTFLLTRKGSHTEQINVTPPTLIYIPQYAEQQDKRHSHTTYKNSGNYCMPHFYKRALFLRDSSFFRFSGIHTILPSARRHKLVHEGLQKEGLLQTSAHPSRNHTTSSRGIL